MKEDVARHIALRIEDSIRTKRLLLERCDEIAEAARTLIRALETGGKALFCGNGGSAADALHLAAELVGRFYRDRRPLPALALVANPSVLTAVGNDYGFQEVFARQVEGLGQRGDVLVGLSTSGNSPNVLHAMRVARTRGMARIALTGETGGELAQEAETCIRVPSRDTPRIQEAHILIGHLLCELAEESLGGRDGGSD